MAATPTHPPPHQPDPIPFHTDIRGVRYYHKPQHSHYARRTGDPTRAVGGARAATHLKLGVLHTDTFSQAKDSPPATLIQEIWESRPPPCIWPQLGVGVGVGVGSGMAFWCTGTGDTGQADRTQTLPSTQTQIIPSTCTRSCCPSQTPKKNKKKPIFLRQHVP